MAKWQKAARKYADKEETYHLEFIDKGLDRSWGFGQNFEVEKLRISGTNLLSPDVFVILETSRLDIGQKMAGLAWFCMSTNFLARKTPSSRPI